MKTPREIAHEITCPPGAGACRCGCDYSEEAARAGMIEALRWVLHDEPKLGDILSKLEELEGAE
jgi:hypothetical protein